MRLIRQALDWLGDLRTGIRQAASDALMVGRIRMRFAERGQSLGQLTDAEFECALAEGIYQELQRRVRPGRLDTIGAEVVHGLGQFERSRAAEPDL